MFNTFLTNILNSYLGEIVEDLDLDNIGSGALHGDILLIDLKLRSDCLSFLELPVEVKYGSIGKLSLKIPWTNLASSPVTVNIQDVYIVAVPLNHRPYYAREDEKLERTRKRRFLQKLEGISVLKKAAVSQNSKEEKLKRELWETMVATFMNNVQLQIERVHIRYEDATSLPGMVISGGLCLQSFTADTTNSKWKETEINGKASTIFKLVKFSQFSLYCVCGDKVEVGKQTNNNWRLAMRDILETVTQGNSPQSEVLTPLSGRMKIMMNRSIKDGSPRLLFDYVLRDMQIQLSKSQYHAMMSIQSAWKFLELSRIHRKFRPKQLVAERPKLWWKYAFNCIRVHFILPYNWSNIRQHRVQYRALVGLWEKRWRQGKNSALKQQIKEVEGRLDVTSIMIAREQAKVLARKPEQPPPVSPSSSRSKLKSFVSGVIAERKAALVNQPMFSFLSTTNIELQLLEICKAMGCAFEPDDSIKPRSYIEHVFNFSLQRCQVRLRSIMVCRVLNFNVCIETRPSGVAYTVACRTENFKVETDMTELQSQPTPILSSNNLMHSKETGWPNLFKLVFEKNPLSSETDFKLDIQLLPVQIYYNEEVFSELLDFLFLPQMDVIQVAWGFIYQGYKFGLQFSRFVRNCLTSRVLCDLNIDLQNPCITIGQYGKISDEGYNFVVDCGTLKVESALVPEVNSGERQSKKYDEFVMTVSGVQVVLVPSRIEWSSLREELSSEYHILPTTKLNLTLSTSVLHTQDIPAWKLDVFLKCAKLNLSDSKLSNIIDFLRDLPLPSRSRNMQKNSTSVKRWKIDKRWIIPNIGKLELLYLENQLSEQDSTESLSIKRELPILPKKSFTNGHNSDHSSDSSLATDLDVQAYCREIDLPGFEDNISAGNKMVAVVQVCVKDAGLIFDRASGSCDKSYLYLGASNITLDIGVLEHGPAVQFGVESVKLLDRQAGVELVTIGADAGSTNQAGAVSLLYRYISPSCPEFRTVFKGVQHSVVCDLGTIQTVLHKTSLWTLYNAASFIIEKSNISMDDMKPVLNKSKSALKRLRKWKPFRIPQSEEETQHVFLNLSLRLHHFSSLLCDSDQEFLNFSLGCLEMDAVFKPRNKLVFRTFISKVLLEDITQFSLFPKVISVEEGDALELKITINLKINQQTSGSFAANVGHFHILILHRVVRLLQFYFSPLDFVMLLGALLRGFHWLIGPSLKIFLNKDKFVDIKFNMEGPTLIIPESRENPQVLAISLGKLSLENLLTKNGRVQNLMLDLQQGQIYSGFMGINQSLELLRVIMQDLSCKVDTKIESQPGQRRYSSVLALEDISFSLDNGDILLFSHILHNNILKLKLDLGSIFEFIPGRFLLPDESDVLVTKDVTIQNKVMIEKVTLNLENVHDDPTEDGFRSSSPSNDSETIFQLQMMDIDFLFQKDPAHISTKTFKIQSMEFVDVKAALEEQWLVDNIKGKPFFHYEEKECGDSISKVLGFNIETLHIYPKSIEKLFSFFLLPGDIPGGLGDSQESLESECDGSASSDLDFTSGNEEVSSGYQTSDIRSPQTNQGQKQHKVLWKIPPTNLVYHCSDLFRKNLLIAKLGGKFEVVKTSGDLEKHLLYIDLDGVDHYDHGLTFQILTKFSILINLERQEDKVSGYVNVTPTEFHLNRKVLGEFLNICQLKQSFVGCEVISSETPRDLWTQRKIQKDRRQKADKHPFLEIISRRLRSSQRKSHGIDLNLDETEIRVLLHDQRNHPIIASKLKFSGKIGRHLTSPEFEGSGGLECILYNEDINRWEHLIQTRENYGKSLRLGFVFGFFDLSRNSSSDCLDDIPLHSERLSIDELLRGDCAETDEKLKIFLNKYVISISYLLHDTFEAPRRTKVLVLKFLTSDDPDRSIPESTEESGSSSFTTAGQRNNKKHFSSIIQVNDEILVNLTSSVLKTVRGLISEEELSSDATSGLGGIINLLGHEADIQYSEIREGKVEKIMEDPTNIDENSSDDECGQDDLPWKISNTSLPAPFTGFEEAGLESLAELTKVITSNILNIDVPDFQPMKILLPKRCSEKVLNLTSELDLDKYPFLLSSTFYGHTQQIELKSCVILENLTSFTLGIYVDSDSLHWKEQGSNPFSSALKLTELSPLSTYNLPLGLSKSAKLSIKPINSKSSVSDSCFSVLQSEFEETFLHCKSLESTSSFGFRVKVSEKKSLKFFQIKPIIKILNRLSVPVHFRLLKDSEFLVANESSEDLYEYNTPCKFFLKVKETECAVTAPTTWLTEETPSVLTCQVKSGEGLQDRLLLTAGGGQLEVRANFQVVNDSNQDFVIDAGMMGRYGVKAGMTTFMSDREAELEPVTTLSIISPETGISQSLSLVKEEDSHVLEVQSKTGVTQILLVRRTDSEEICLIRLSSLWAVRNNTEKEFLLQETPRGTKWTTLRAGETTAVTTETFSPSFVLRDSDSACQTDEFKLTPKKPKLTLRLNSGSGVNLCLKHQKHDQNIIEISELADNFPFTFENHSADLVVKVKQLGSAECWLVSPGHLLHYSWDNNVTEDPKCLWTVYGSCDQPFNLQYQPGRVLWGEEKVLYKTVRKSYSASSDSETSDTEESGEETSSDSHVFRKKGSVSSPSLPQNIVYKHRKTVFWISDSQDAERTTVYFLSSRKVAARQLRRLTGRERRTLQVTWPGLHISVLSQSQEILSLVAPRSLPQWSLLINNTWRNLGLELSAAIEVASLRGLPGLNINNILQVDLQQQCVTCPVFAPLRRVEPPALALLADWAPSSLCSLTAALPLLEVRRGGVLELSVRNSLLEVERLVKEPHRSLQALNIDMDSLEIGDTSSKESLGLEQEELIRSLKRQRVSVSSVQIGGFKLIRKCPGDQFYQKLQTGKVSRTTQIPSLEFPIWDKSTESTMNLIYSHVLAELWANKPAITQCTDKKTLFWRHLLHQKELYIKHQDTSGSVLDSPHYVRPGDLRFPENPVLHHVLHHLKLTSEDKTNVYQRVLYSTARSDLAHHCRAPPGYLGLRPLTPYSALGHSITTQVTQSELYIHHVSLQRLNTILVTDKRCLSLLHNRNKTQFKVEWSLPIHTIHNLPVIEDDKIVIHVNKGNSIEPQFIISDNLEKLKSVQLALEYTLLLTMPFTSLQYDRNVC